MSEETKQLGRVKQGQKPKGGQVGSGTPISFGIWSDDTALSLKDQQQRPKEFLRIYKADPRVSQAVDERISFLANGTFEVTPASDSPEDIRIADFVAANLIGKDTEEFGRRFWAKPVFANRLYTIAFAMLVYGFCMYHTKFKKVDDYFFILDTLTFVEPETITDWQLDATDQIKLIQRSYHRGDDEELVNEELKARDLCLYTYRLVGARYQGISLVRSMYAAALRKDWMQKLKMLAAKRLMLPIPSWKVGEDVTPGSDEWNKMEQFLQSNLNPQPETSYVMFKGGDGPTFLQPDNIDAFKEFSPLLAAENAEEAAGGGNKGMLLGDDQTGNRSLGESIGSREALGQMALPGFITAAENHGTGGLAGLVTKLVDLNFQNVEKYPKLVWRPNESVEARSNASAFLDAAQKAQLTILAEDEMKVREAFGFDDGITLEMIEAERARKEELANSIAEKADEGEDGDAADNFGDDGIKEETEDTDD